MLLLRSPQQNCVCSASGCGLVATRLVARYNLEENSPHQNLLGGAEVSVYFNYLHPLELK